MKVFAISLFTLLICLNAHARKPAVEDFVGVVPETYKETPKGTEVLFDFGNKIQAVEKNKLLIEQQGASLNNWSGLIGLGFFLALPFLMWTFITKAQFKMPTTKETVHTPTPTITTVDNSTVKNLEDYRQKQNDDDNKKAS